MASLDDFKKLDLRVAKILAAERIQESEKLLKLKIDLGGEERQIIAGIGKVYDPSSLVGREIVVIANLEPKTMLGLESSGMLLAADSDEGPVLLTPDREVAPGTKIC